MGRNAIEEQPEPPWPTPLFEQFGRTEKVHYRVVNRGRAGWQVDRNRQKRFLWWRWWTTWWTLGTFTSRQKAKDWIEEAKGKLLRGD